MISKLQPKRSVNTQCGFTLVELMIAMVISLIILAGVVTVYSSSKRTHILQKELATLQENARYAFQSIAEDIRGAGFGGCNPTINNMLDSSDPGYDSALFDFQAGIGGWEYVATPTSPGTDYTITSLTDTGVMGDWIGYDWDNDGAGDPLTPNLAGQAVQGNDVLVVKTSETRDDLIPAGNTPANAATIVFTGQTNIEPGTIVIFSDCKKADVFQNNSAANSVNLTRPAAGTPGNVNPATSSFSHEYSTKARIQVVRSHAYFVGNSVASGGPALFRADYSQGSAGVVPEELVEGVENMQILYGEDLTPNDDNIRPDRYVTADNITDPDNVISIRISLLLRTPQELNHRTANTRTFRLGGVDNATGVDVTTMSDRRIRKSYTTTIFMRNKGVFRERPGT